MWFSLPGDLPSSAAFSRLRWQSEMPRSCARGLLSSWQKMQLNRSLQLRWGRGFLQPFIVPRKAVAFGQSWICKSWIGPFTSSRSRCWRRGASSDASYPRIGLQWSTWRMLAFMSRFSLDADRSSVCVRGAGMAVRVLPFELSSLSPRVFTKSQRAPCPITGSVHKDPRLSQAWPAHENSCAITGTWCSGTSASWGFGSTGKRASSPLCRESLFSVWS